MAHATSAEMLIQDGFHLSTMDAASGAVFPYNRIWSALLLQPAMRPVVTLMHMSNRAKWIERAGLLTLPSTPFCRLRQLQGLGLQIYHIPPDVSICPAYLPQKMGELRATLTIHSYPVFRTAQATFSSSSATAPQSVTEVKWLIVHEARLVGYPQWSPKSWNANREKVVACWCAIMGSRGVACVLTQLRRLEHLQGQLVGTETMKWLERILTGEEVRVQHQCVGSQQRSLW